MFEATDPRLNRQPLMKPHLVCRSHKRFNPAIALLTHFILPCHQLYRQRFLSTASETAAGPAPQDDTVPHPPVKNHASSRETRDGNLVREKKPTVDRPRANVTESLKIKYRRPGPPADDALALALRALDKSQDYEGIHIRPVRATAAKDRKMPWCVGLDKVPYGRERLSLEIAQFYDYAKPERREAIARKSVVQQIRAHICKSIVDCELEVFGSEQTGLALPLSDIDLRLVRHKDIKASESNLPPEPLERDHLRGVLYNILRNGLRDHKSYIDPHIRNARYPLVHLIDRKTGLEVQIVCSNGTSKSTDMMQAYMEEFVHLRPVFFLVKTILYTRGLTEVHRGGMGSYTIFMMIVAALKHTKPEPTHVNDAAGTLMTFLNFWSEVDLTQGISIEPPVLFNKADVPVMTDETRAKIQSGKQKQLPLWMLCLRDPADETNNLGRRASSIKHVIVTLRALRDQLLSELSQQKKTTSFLDNMVGDVDHLQFARRAKLRNRGLVILNDGAGHFASAARAVKKTMR